MAIKQSGSNRTPAERAAGGRPNKLFPLVTEVAEEIVAMADGASLKPREVSQAMVVSLAVMQLAQRRAKDPAKVDAELRAYAAEDKRKTAERKKEREAP